MGRLQVACFGRTDEKFPHPGHFQPFGQTAILVGDPTDRMGTQAKNRLHIRGGWMEPCLQITKKWPFQCPHNINLTTLKQKPSHFGLGHQKECMGGEPLSEGTNRLNR